MYRLASPLSQLRKKLGSAIRARPLVCSENSTAIFHSNCSLRKSNYVEPGLYNMLSVFGNGVFNFVLFLKRRSRKELGPVLLTDVGVLLRWRYGAQHREMTPVLFNKHFRCPHCHSDTAWSAWSLLWPCIACNQRTIVSELRFLASSNYSVRGRPYSQEDYAAHSLSVSMANAAKRTSTVLVPLSMR